MCGSCGCCLDYLLANTVPVVCLCVLSCMYAIPVQHSTAQHSTAPHVCAHSMHACAGGVPWRKRAAASACVWCCHTCLHAHTPHTLPRCMAGCVALARFAGISANGRFSLFATNSVMPAAHQSRLTANMRPDDCLGVDMQIPTGMRAWGCGCGRGCE
jgi:hypothetical protein